MIRLASGSTEGKRHNGEEKARELPSVLVDEDRPGMRNLGGGAEIQARGWPVVIGSALLALGAILATQDDAPSCTTRSMKQNLAKLPNWQPGR